MPPERIVQLHFVGTHRNGNRLIDAHAHKTQSEIWEVFRAVCAQTDVKGAVLERDDNIPPFCEILEEVRIARNLFENPQTKFETRKI
jgi:uncharacterized protein (UPF0276 family)